MKKVSCFLSSTFNDMQSERDYFRLTLEDKVNEKLRTAGLFLEFVDLRWGVNVQTEDEREYDKKVLNVCLGEIENAKPFFIVFLGERYGWTPNSEDVLSVLYELGNLKDNFENKSITEIEISYALNTYIDTKKCLFYFRNPVDFGDDDKARKKYVSTGEDFQRLYNLKEKIIELFPNQVRTYDALWNKDKESFILGSDFEKLVYDDVENLFNDEYDLNLFQTDLQKKKSVVDLTIAKKTALFAGRTSILSQAFNYIANGEKKILDIVSEEGFGKSVFISKLASQLMLDADKIVLPYVCDSVDEVFSLRELIVYFLETLGFNEDNSVYTIEELIKKFQQTLNVIACDKQVVILIDSIDRIILDSKEWSFLNTFAYNNVKLVISRDIDASMARFISAMDSVSLRLSNYSADDINDVVNKFFSLSHRTIGKDVVKELVSKEKRSPKTCSNPSYLNLLLQEIDSLSEKDFKIINQRVSKDLTFAKSVEKFQKEIINTSGRTFEKEIERQKSKIEAILPIAKYYFEFLAISPHGISEREMDFVLEKINQKQSSTDFSLFVKTFKCFLVCDDKGYWHFSQRKVLNFFASKISKESKEQYYKILLELYHQPGKTQLGYRYALTCYFALKDFNGAYNFLLTNKNENIVVDAFVKHINSSKTYLNDFRQLLVLDSSRQLEEKISTIIAKHEISFERWYILLNKVYSNKTLKEIALSKDKATIAFKNVIRLALLAYDKGEYVKGFKLISKIRKKFESFISASAYFAYEIKSLEIMLKAKLGKKINYEPLRKIINKILSSIKNKTEQSEEKWKSEKEKIIYLLQSIDRIYDATEETKERERLSLSFVDECLEFGYLEGEERIFWLSKKFTYLSREFLLTTMEEKKGKYNWFNNIFSRFQEKSTSGFLKVRSSDERKREILLQEQHNEIEKYIENEKGDKKLIAKCCISLAKYHDNVAIMDNYIFSQKAVKITRENLNDDFSVASIKDYQEALEQKVKEDEMWGRLKKSDAKELLRISKLSIQINPSTQNYDSYFEAYNQCERLGMLDVADKDKNKEYKKRRKKEVKFEVSEERQLQQRKERVFALCEMCFFIFIIVFLFLFLSKVAFISQFFILLVLSIIVGYLGGISINKLFAPKNKKDVVIGFALLSLFVASMIYLFNYSIKNSIIYDYFVGENSENNNNLIRYASFIRYGGVYVLELIFKLVMLLLPLVTALVTQKQYLKNLRLRRSSSDIKNYKTSVLEFTKQKTFINISGVLVLFLQLPIIYYLINKYIYTINIKYIERLNFVSGIRVEKLPYLLFAIILISILTIAVDLFMIWHSYRYLMMQKDRYNKRRSYSGWI